jgi:MFS family permease
MPAIAGQSHAAAPSGFGILLTASLVSSLIMLESNIVAVSLPAMGRALGASFTDIQWVISAYVVTYAFLLLASGNYADLYGRKKSMVIGPLIFAVASLACGFATTSLLLNAARAAQGLGGAFLLTASLAIIGNRFKGAERTRAFALRGGGEPWHRPGHTPQLALLRCRMTLRMSANRARPEVSGARSE